MRSDGAGGDGRRAAPTGDLVVTDLPVGVAARTDRGAWSLSWHGVRLVAALELRQRVRSSRWVVVLVLWFALIAGITGLTFAAMGSDRSGPVLFSVVVVLVLTLGLVVAPSLTATSVNGDRGAGTLAPLQMTLLSPAEIAVGKLAAAWVTSLVLLATASPFVLLSLVLPGTSLLRVVVALGTVALVLLTVCGIALGWSAVCARTASSAVLTYLSVAGLSVFTLVFFGLSLPLVAVDEPTRVLTHPAGDPFEMELTRDDCVEVVEERTVLHSEWTWWLLAANPYVVVADAAPRAADPDPTDEMEQDEDLLHLVQAGVREMRDGPDEVVDECWAAWPDEGLTYEGARDTSPVWPFGLAAYLALGGVGVGAAVRRLSTPVGRLARGTRIA
ncbi:ABC transporter permease [Thalassiella azotivora]